MKLSSLLLLPLLLVSVFAGLFYARSSYVERSPLVVAERSLLQQTGQTGVVLFTPKVTGNFRVSIYQNQLASTYAPIIQVTWTDELGTEQTDPDGSVCPLIINSSQTTVSGCTVFVHAIAGYPIQLNTYVNPAQPAYSLYATVEEM